MLDKELNMKQNLIGEGFSALPKNNFTNQYLSRVNINGEIVSGENFDGNKLFIIYELFKPNYWKFDYDEDLLNYGEGPDIEMNRPGSVT